MICSSEDAYCTPPSGGENPREPQSGKDAAQRPFTRCVINDRRAEEQDGKCEAESGERAEEEIPRNPANHPAGWEGGSQQRSDEPKGGDEAKEGKIVVAIAEAGIESLFSPASPPGSSAT